MFKGKQAFFCFLAWWLKCWCQWVDPFGIMWSVDWTPHVCMLENFKKQWGKFKEKNNAHRNIYQIYLSLVLLFCTEVRSLKSLKQHLFMLYWGWCVQLNQYLSVCTGVGTRFSFFCFLHFLRLYFLCLFHFLGVTVQFRDRLLRSLRPLAYRFLCRWDLLCWRSLK